MRDRLFFGAVCLALGVAWFHTATTTMKRQAVAEAMAAEAQARVDSLKEELQTASWELDRALERAEDTRQDYDSLRQLVQDTVIRWVKVPAGAPPKADTLLVVPPGYVKAADDRDAACALLEVSCAEYRVTAEQESAAKDRVIEQLKIANKSQPFRVRDALLGGLAAAGVCYLAR